MAVEARHLNLFPQQISPVEGYGNVFGSQIGYVAPLTDKTTETIFPVYGSVPFSRKRSRESSISPNLVSSFPNQSANNRCGNSFSFLGEDISLQIQHQQLDIDRFISQHNENVRMEIEQRRRNYSRRMVSCIQENVMKKLKAKEEEMEEMGKLNWALEQRIKSLSVENQLWKDLAQSNEATVNALRSNLEQVLAQVENEKPNNVAEAIEDDAQSWCGSNFERRVVVECATSASNSSDRLCRSCGKEESCVLVLPCRHLCLCTVCGSSVHTCPVCYSVKTASVHVNLDS